MKRTFVKTVEVDQAYEIMLAIEREVERSNEIARLQKDGWKVSRRGFLKGMTAGGIVIALVDSNVGVLAQGRDRKPSSSDVNAWIKIEKSGKITAFTPKIEYGQGIRAGLTMVVAEELCVPVEDVTLVMGETDLVQPDPSGGTWGSQSTIAMYPRMRQAAAVAFSILCKLAAEKLGTEADNVEFGGGIAWVKGDKKNSVKISDLVSGKLPNDIAPSKPNYKSKSDYSVVGKDRTKVDTAEKIMGVRKFCSDIVIDGMLFGAAIRGSMLDKFDADKAAKLKGVVKVVRGKDFAVVVAERTDIARKAAQVGADWPGPNDDSDKFFEEMENAAARRQKGKSRGNVEDGLALADKTIDAAYRIPHVQHSPIETESATAVWDGDKLTIYTGTQTPFGTRGQIAAHFKIVESSVNIIVPDIGGAFGGKSFSNVQKEAAFAAKEVGKPVKVVWSREEEFAFMYYRQAVVGKVKAGVKKDGTITAWDFTVVNQDLRGADFVYNCENYVLATARGKGYLRTGAWRGVAGPVNCFIREAAIDELACAIEMDPGEFRLKNLRNEGTKKVLQTALDKFGWKKIKPPSKQGIGLAVGEDVGSEIAECVKISLQNGKVRVEKVVAAMDCGLIINPEGIRLQTEGGIIMGISTALYEEARFKDGKLLTTNFDTYNLARFSDVPDIEVHLVDSGDSNPHGVGEPPIFPITPAILNAYYDATGKRVRQIPLNKE